MLGRLGLWKILGTMRALPVERRRRLSPSVSQPPLYFSWFSHCVGKPVPGLVSTLFHHMYSVPRRSIQMFLHAIEQVWQPMHLSRWNTIETCERTFISSSQLPVLSFERARLSTAIKTRAPIQGAFRPRDFLHHFNSGSFRTRTWVSRLQPVGPQ